MRRCRSSSGPARARKRASQPSAALSGMIERMRRFSGGNAIPAEPRGSGAGAGSPRSRLHDVPALGRGRHPRDEPQEFRLLLLQHRIEARGLAHRGLDPGGELSGAFRRALRVRQPSPEPGRRRIRDQRVQRQRPPVLVPEPVERLDLLADDHRLGRNRVVVPACSRRGGRCWRAHGRAPRSRYRRP